MGRAEHSNASRAGHVCPACHNPVTDEVARHKTMGVFVPQWKPGPCHNPDCPECAQGERHSGKEPDHT